MRGAGGVVSWGLFKVGGGGRGVRGILGGGRGEGEIPV